MNILILDSISEIITATLTEAQTTAMDITVSYGDATSTSMTEGVQLSASNGVTPVTICSAPAASTRRLIRNITVYNKDGVAHGVILKLYSGGVYYGITKQNILAGETWSFGEAVSNLPSIATGAEIDAGTDDMKYVTPKAIADSYISGVLETQIFS